MADVFVSYSRLDAAFVHELHAFLTDRGKDVWIDWEDIPPAAEWAEDIEDNIDAAESFVFVVSSNSLASRYSLDELRHAEERGKRIVPIACDGADPDKAPEGLRQLNWIWCRSGDDRSGAFARVLQALDTDLAWAEVHTRLLVRAVEWDERRDASLLLRGRDLEEALQKVTANAGKEPVPTELQREYLAASRGASRSRQRIILGSVSLALAVSVALGLVALLQRNLANERAQVARSQAFAAQAVAALDSDPAAALADAVRAVETHRTPEAGVALRRAILANPVAYSIPAETEPSAAARFDAVAFGDGGRALAALGPDGMLRIRESAGGRETAALPARSFAVEGPLLVAGRARDARVLDLRSGEVTETIRAPAGGRVLDVGFLRGTPTAALAAGGQVVVEALGGGRPVTLGLRPVSGLRVLFAADGERVVTVGGSTRVWDAGSGRQLARLPGGASAAISRDGRFVATIDGAHSQATLWDDGGRSRVARLGLAGGVLFSRDGRLVLAVGLEGGAGVWRSATGRQVAAFPGFGRLDAGLEDAMAVFSEFSPGAAFSDEGRLVALANADGNVRVWDVESRKQVGAAGTGWANALAVAPRGGTLAALAWNGELTVARAPASVPLRTGSSPAGCDPPKPIVSPDGVHVIAPAAGGAGVWTLEGRRIATLRPPARAAGAGITAGSVAVSGDGRTVAAASAPQGCIFFGSYGSAVWRLGSTAPLRELPADAPVSLDAAGRLVTAGGGVWPTSGGPRVTGLGNVVVLSPDGRRALVARNARIEVADIASGATVAALRGLRPPGDDTELDPTNASFSPDGTRLLTGWGSTLRLWDATTGEPIAALGRRDEHVQALGFGGGGRLALATFADRAAVVAAEDGELLSSVAGTFLGGAVSPDGTLAAVPGAEGAVDFVELATGSRVALQTDTGTRLRDVTFAPSGEVIVARDSEGDVHVVLCEICAPDDELLELARGRLAVLSRIEAEPPPIAATG